MVTSLLPPVFFASVKCPYIYLYINLATQFKRTTATFYVHYMLYEPIEVSTFYKNYTIAILSCILNVY